MRGPRRLTLALVLASPAVALGVYACQGDEPALPPGVDGSTGDSGVGTDADGAPSDAGPRTFCSDVDADFCEDFDRGATSPWGFQATDLSAPGATITANEGAFVSPPRSGLLRVPALAGQFVGAYLIGRVATSDARGVDVELDWRLDSVGSAADAGLSDFFIVKNDANAGIGLHMQSSGDGGAAWSFAQSFAPVAPPKPAPSWNHLAIGVSFGERDAASATLTQNGEPVTVQGPDIEIPKPASTVAFLVGVSSVRADTPSISISVDNVVMRLRR